MSEQTRRVTAFGVVKALREKLGLDPKATEQDVLDAALAIIEKRGGKVKSSE